MNTLITWVSTIAPWISLVQTVLILGLAYFAPMGRTFCIALTLMGAMLGALSFLDCHAKAANLLSALATHYVWPGWNMNAISYHTAYLENVGNAVLQGQAWLSLLTITALATASHLTALGLYKRHFSDFEVVGILVSLFSASLAIVSTYGLLAPVLAIGLFAGTSRASSHHRILEGKEAARDLFDGLFRLRLNLIPYKKHGIWIHEYLRIPRSFENRGIIIFGAPGSGKSHLIKTFFLPQFRKRKDRVVVFDYKGEFTQNMGEDADVLILSPLDERSCIWDIAHDVDTEVKAWEFGRMVVQKGDSAVDEVFEDWARDLLTASVIKLQQEKGKRWSFHDFYKDSQDLETLIEAVKRYRPESQFAANFDGDSRQFEAIKGTIRRALVRLEPLSRAWPDTKDSLEMFSIQGWLAEARPLKTTVIVRYDPLYGETMGPFVSNFFNFLFASVLSLEDANGKHRNRRIWAVLDEFQILPKIPKLFEAARAGRSKGLRMLLGTQDLGQTDQMYRKEGSRDTLVNLIGFKFIGHLGSHGMQEFAAGLLSKNKTKVMSRNIQNSNGKLSASYSEQEKFEPAISPGEFGAIGVPTSYTGASFWMVHQGWAPVKLRYITRPTKDPYAALKPAPWLRDLDRDWTNVQRKEPEQPSAQKTQAPIKLGKALESLNQTEGSRC